MTPRIVTIADAKRYAKSNPHICSFVPKVLNGVTSVTLHLDGRLSVGTPGNTVRLSDADMFYVVSRFINSTH